MKKILCAAFVLCLFSCKKEDKKDELTQENVAGTYKKTAETTNGVSSWDTNNYDDCEMDNLIQLKTDNTYTYTDAGTVCSPSDSDSGLWSLAGSTLTIDGQNLNVESFNGTQLVVKESVTLGGTTWSTVSTLTKQ